jgi:hypothetical protein
MLRKALVGQRVKVPTVCAIPLDQLPSPCLGNSAIVAIPAKLAAKVG